MRLNDKVCVMTCPNDLKNIFRGLKPGKFISNNIIIN